MNDENMNQEGAPMPEESEHKPVGPIIGIVIIILVIIIGGLYFWGRQLSRDAGEDPLAEELRNVSDSDEIEAIEADLDIDLEGLDAELEDLDAELEDL